MPQKIQTVATESAPATQQEIQLFYSEHIGIVNKLKSEHAAEINEVINKHSKTEEELAKLKEAITNVSPYVRNDIPSMFEIAGIVYKVDMKDNSKDEYGTFNPSLCEVTLYSKSDGEAVNPQLINKVFYHELVHCIAHSFRLDDLYENEVAIDNLARGFMMFLQTRRYIKPEEDGTKQDNQ